MRGKTWLDFWNLLTTITPLHDLIISPHVKHPLKNLPQKFCSPMQSFFKKKVSPYFVRGRGDTTLYLQIFSHFQKFIPNFCGTNYDLSSKTT